jgi:signal transduction histidine kinase
MLSRPSIVPAPAPIGGVRRLRPPIGWAVAVAALAGCAGALLMVAVTSPAGDRIDRVLYEGLLVGVPVGVGLYAIGLPHSERFGILLVGAGLIWSLTALGESSQSLPYSVGRVSAWLIFPLLIYLMLVYPTGRLAPGLDRRVYEAITLLIALLYVGSALFVDHYPERTPWASCRADLCPPNSFQVLDSEPAVMENVVRPAREILGIVLLGAVAYSLARRMRAATPLERRVQSPVVVMSIVSIVVLMAYLVTRRIAPDAAAVDTLGWAWSLCIPGIAAAFLAGLLRQRLLLGEVLVGLSGAWGRGVDGSKLRAALAVALSDPEVDVLFPDDAPGRWRDSEGRATSRSAAAEGGRAVTLIRDDGAAVAALVHAPALRDDERLLGSVTAVIRAAVQQRQLTSRLAASLDDLEESRKRIARAADLERSRIERDLHDGAQQRLVSMRIKLSLAEELSVDDPAAGAAAMHELGSEIDLALEDLRSLAHGVYPSLLSDRGLEEALRGVAAASPLPIHLYASGLTRYPAEVETAVYFTCLEAVQNAIKHARSASGVWISVQQNHSLRVEVRDDGPGFFPPARNANGGLRNMRDRVEAVGGWLTIDTSPGHGTRILGSIPLT